MYADRYARPEGIKPGSLTIAIAVNAAIIGALIFSAPEVLTKLPPSPFTTSNIPVDPPPPPDPTKPEAKPQPHQKTLPTEPKPDLTPKVAEAGESPYTIPYVDPVGSSGTGAGPIEIVVPAPSMPVLTEATVDPRYANLFQPEYPAGERRAEHFGKVVIRVLIGTDGRVKRAERVSAASDAFWVATERRALAKWRFRPATRNGVPVEAWRTMTVRFELEG